MNHAVNRVHIPISRTAQGIYDEIDSGLLESKQLLCNKGLRQSRIALEDDRNFLHLALGYGLYSDNIAGCPILKKRSPPLENDPNKIEPSIYRFILKHTTRDQILILLITVASMPVIYGSLEVPKIIINSAINGSNIPEMVLGMPMDQISYLLVLCLVFLILVLIAGGLKYLNNVYRGVVGERMLRRFRYDLYCRVLRFPNQRFKHVSQAEILPMITAETEPLGGFIGDAFALPAFQGGLLLTYLLFIFNQDFWL